MASQSPYTFQTNADKCIYTSVMDALEKYADQEKKVLISAEDPSNFLTHTELKRQIIGTEAFLHRIGFQKGHVGACVMPSNIEIIPFYLAVVGRGGIYTGMMPILTEFETHNELCDSGATVVFTTTEQLEKVQAATANMDKKMIRDLRLSLFLSFAFSLSYLKASLLFQTIICLEVTESSKNIHSWSDVIKTNGRAPTHLNNIHDTAVQPYSSGTTGLRKGIKLSHYNIMSAVLNVIRHAEEYLPKPISDDGEIQSVYDRVQVLSFPAFHISGKLLVLPPILAGASVVMIKQFDVKVLLETVLNYKVHNILISPVVILGIVKSPLAKEYDWSSLRYVSCGGAPLRDSLARELLEKYPQVLLTQSYGMSECMFSTFPLCDNKENFQAAGYITPGYEAKIIDVETGEQLGPNQAGEFIVKGPSLMNEYHNNPKATAESRDEDGFFHTGDFGYFTEKGELRIIDRKKDLIKINDYGVAPAEIESALAMDPRIQDVAVVAVPHEKSGQVPGAFIVKNHHALTEEEVLLLIRQRICDFKWGEGVITFVDSIPKLPSGKVIKRQLLELLA